MTVFLSLLGLIAFLAVSLMFTLKLLSHARKENAHIQADLDAVHQSLSALRAVTEKQEAEREKTQSSIDNREYFRD